MQVNRVFFLFQGLLINERIKINDFFFCFTVTSKVSMVDQKKSKYNHYDIPKFHYDNNQNFSNNIKQNLIADKNEIPRLSLQRQSNCLIDDIDFDDVENTSITEQNNNNYKGNISMTHDKVSAYSYTCLCRSFFFFLFSLLPTLLTYNYM